MEPLRKGGLTARLAEGRADMARVMALRRAAFPRASGSEEDAQDALSAHVMVEGEGRLLGYFRVMLFGWGAGLAQGYAARFYDVGPLSGYARPIAEMGRFCLAPGGVHPDVLRLAWGAMARLVEEGQAGLMLGCTSFRGAAWETHRAGLALLASEFIGPAEHRPGRKAAEVVDYPALVGPVTDRRAALGALPPLLRTYLGWGDGSATMRWWTGTWTRCMSSPASRWTGFPRRGWRPCGRWRGSCPQWAENGTIYISMACFPALRWR